MEIKQFSDFSLEIKALGSRDFEGYGSVFGNVDGGGDAILPGAFRETLASRRDGALPQMFWMHDPRSVPGVWEEMREDAHGLHVRGTLADTPLGNEMRELLKIKAVRGLSIGYMIEDSEYKDDVRLIKEVDLWEVSIVSMAMNPLAQVTGVKSRLSKTGEYVPTEEQHNRILREAIAHGKKSCEHSLRDAGYSRKAARTLVAQHFDGGAGEIPAALANHRSDSDATELARVQKALSELAESLEGETVARKMSAFG